MEAQIKYEKQVTKEDVIAEFGTIWAEFRRRFSTGGDHTNDDLSAFYKDMQTEHKQLSSSYPIVLRYMCELGQYHPTALRRYLSHIEHHPWKSVDSYLESQAKYVLILFKQANPKYRENDARACYDTALRRLRAEHKQFEAETEQAKKEVDKNHDRMVIRNRMELREHFAKYGPAAGEVPLSVVRDAGVDPAVGEAKNVEIAIPDVDPDATLGGLGF